MLANLLDAKHCNGQIKTKSQAIENARLLCILFMSWVHLFVMPEPDTPVVQVFKAIIDVMGRSSVPLLSVISGLLIVPFYNKRSWREGVINRVKILFVPMVVVNLIAWVLMQPEGPWYNLLFGLNGRTAIAYTAFLRDLLVLVCIAPLLIVLVRRLPRITLLATAIFYLANVETALILRPSILGFFMVGIYISTWGEIKLPTKPILVGLIAVIAIELLFDPVSSWYDLIIRRPVLAMAFWVIAREINNIPDFGRSAYWFFLAHGVMFRLIAVLTWNLPSIFFLPVWIAVPPICFALVIAAYRVVDKVQSAGGEAVEAKF